ncbi:MAG TPA: hypothetical protein VGG46_07610 [Terriglobales bacterium]|jgi:hypothetical protein
MPEDKPYVPPPSPLPPNAASPSSDQSVASPSAQGELSSDFNIGEEYGTAKKNLPPVKILGICAAVVIVVVAVASFLQRPKPSASGAIDEVTAVEIPNQNSVMVAINVSLKNTSEKPLWIQSMKAEIATPEKTYSDDAAAAVDLDRYYQALPTLKEHAQAPLTLEEKIDAGAQASGTMIVSFPVTLDAFNNRKSLTVTIWPDRQPLPLIFTK